MVSNKKPESAFMTGFRGTAGSSGGARIALQGIQEKANGMHSTLA